MPNASLTTAIKEAYASAPADKYIIHTLEFRQTGVQNSVRIARSHFDITAVDEDSNTVVFSAGQFTIGLPSSTDEGVISTSISISNIDNAVGAFLETARSSTTPSKVIYRPYMSDDLTTPAWSPPLSLFIRNAQITRMQVQVEANMADVVNSRFPSIYYTREKFPGLR